MGKSVIIGAVAIVILAGGGYLVLRDSSPETKSNSATTSSSATSDTPAVESTEPNQPSSATITYSDDGFSPKTVTVKSGDTITIKNISSKDVEFDSDPHPDHTDNPDLNVGNVAPGKSTTFKVSKTGTHDYHNHLNSTERGTIVVE